MVTCGRTIVQFVNLRFRFRIIIKNGEALPRVIPYNLYVRACLLFSLCMVVNMLVDMNTMINKCEKINKNIQSISLYKIHYLEYRAPACDYCKPPPLTLDLI